MFYLKCSAIDTSVFEENSIWNILEFLVSSLMYCLQIDQIPFMLQIDALQ